MILIYRNFEFWIRLYIFFFFGIDSANGSFYLGEKIIFNVMEMKREYLMYFIIFIK